MNTSTNLPTWRKGDYTKSVSAKKKYGGGVINELSHELDLMLYLFGKPKQSSTNSWSRNGTLASTPNLIDALSTYLKDLGSL